MNVKAEFQTTDMNEPDVLVECHFGQSQIAQEGKEMGRPKASTILLRIQNTKDMPYYFAWAKAPNDKRSGRISFKSASGQRVSEVSFTDAVCSSIRVHYTANEENPMYIDFTLSIKELILE